MDYVPSQGSHLAYLTRISPLEVKEALLKREAVCKYQGGILLLPLVFFEQADELRHHQVSSLLQRTGPEELPPGRVGCSCLLSLDRCCSLVCGKGHGRNPGFMSHGRFHLARVCSRWTVIMTWKINIHLLSSLFLELREVFGPLWEISCRFRDLFCETILITKKRNKSYFAKIKSEVNQSLLLHLI